MNDVLLEKLLNSKKYRDVCPATIERVLGECLAKHKKPKDADKAAREALHGITAAFMTDAEYKQAFRDAAHIEGDEALAAVLGCHASTRERLPLAATDALYARLFETTGRPDSILDLACGLNPVYLHARLDCRITGVDISGSCIRILNEAIAAPSVAGVHADLLCEGAIPAERYDVALLFKVLPLLERQRAGAAGDVLKQIDAAFIVASFPTRTLGGRNVGMEAHYSEWMESHMPGNREIAGRFTTDNELFYILKENS